MHRPYHFAPARLKSLGEILFDVDAGCIIGNDRVNSLDALLKCPFGKRHGQLLLAERDANYIWRTRRNKNRSRSVHYNHWSFGLRCHRRHSQRVGSQSETGQKLDVLAGNKLLRGPPRYLGVQTRGVTIQYLEARRDDLIAVLFHEELDCPALLLAI